MSKNIYFQDTEPGSLSDIYEIKILICTLLEAVNQPMGQEQINTVFQYNQTVNYFNFCQAITEMLQTGHIVQQTNNSTEVVLALSDLGKDTAHILSDAIPKSTREKTIKTAKSLIERQRQDKGKKVTIENTNDGYFVHLIISESGSELLNLKLFSPDREQAEYMAEQCNTNTIAIYKSIISTLFQDVNTLQEITYELQKQNHRKSYLAE